MQQCERSELTVTLPNLAVFQGKHPVEKHHESYNCSWEQHSCVPTQPGEVEANLLPKVSSRSHNMI